MKIGRETKEMAKKRGKEAGKFSAHDQPAKLAEGFKNKIFIK